MLTALLDFPLPERLFATRVEDRYPLRTYQTVYGDTPGSAEMPSASRPFTLRLLRRLRALGVSVARIVLHAGVSSHEIETASADERSTYPEPYEVPGATVAAVNATRRRGGRVIAVGTTVVRALEAWHEFGDSNLILR